MTENAMVGRGEDRIAGIVQSLRQRGISVALDDFGTGCASLTHLKRIKVDRLKIDRSFVCGIGIDPEDAAIVRAVIGLGTSLGLEVVAEGVETERQLDFLRPARLPSGPGPLFRPAGARGRARAHAGA